MRARVQLHRTLALAALALGLEPFVVTRLGSRAPSWSHWLCSAHGTPRVPHGVLALLAAHWPHFLPLVLALGTVVYLWRADAQHRAATLS